MNYRQTEDDAEASQFATDMCVRESMEQEGFDGEVLHRGKGQIIYRRAAWQDARMGLCVGLVFLFRGFKDPKENGWAATVASEINSDEELAEVKKTLERVQAGVLEGTKRLRTDDIF